MINFNGEFKDNDEAVLNIDNRGYKYGDGLFETLRVINGKVIFWEDHYFRLMASMRIMRIDIPMEFSPEFLREEIIKTVKKNGLSEKPARVNLYVHRKSGGLYLPEQRNAEYMVKAVEMEDPFYVMDEQDCEVELFKDHYVNRGLLSSLKSTNRVVNILGSIYASENGYKNCLLLNDKKSVIEVLNGNLFLVKDKTIKTPPTTEGCINGVTRKQLTKMIGNLPDYELKEVAISPFELQKADELFYTNSIIGIQSITKYRKKEFENTVAKDLLGKLNASARLNG